MAVLLAPYNDSMRLGMGFNSYTQTLCIDGAVKVSNTELVRAENPSQVVTYSSKLVERLSDIVGSMNVSHCASIRKGTVEIAGNGDAINEDKIKSSDINAVVSVKVVNQTLVINDNPQFQPIQGVYPGTSRFNDNFGDCYISGFITGGSFDGVISMRVIDRSKTTSVTNAIKKGLRSEKGAVEFSLEMDSTSSISRSSEVLGDTETTITVSWMGGGQVKDPRVPWTLNSVYAAAEAFPMLVSKCPQKTWAILTKYNSNRSFVKHFLDVSFSPLEYDLVAGYTSSLFDNYMEYKQLIKVVQDIMANPDDYVETLPDGLPIHVDTLVAVRSALRIEMNKIVQAVDILAKEPKLLKTSGKLMAEPVNERVKDIIKRATSKVTESEKRVFWAYEQQQEPVVVASLPDPATPAQPQIREQWVWVAATAQPAPMKDPPASKALSRGDPGWYEAWVEDDPEVMDDRVVPTEKGNVGENKLCWIKEFEPPLALEAGAPTPTGTWEWGSVDVSPLSSTATTAATKEGVVGNPAGVVPSVQPATAVIVPPAKPSQPAGTTTVEPTKSTSADASADTKAKTSASLISSTQVDQTISKTKPAEKKVDGEVQGQRDPSANSEEPMVKFDMMIAPEIWKAYIPTPKNETVKVTAAGASIMPASLAGGFPTAPTDDLHELNKRSKDQTVQKLEIHSAICGVVDVTDDVRDMIKPDNTLQFSAGSVANFGVGHSNMGVKPEELSLAFVFQYAGQPMRMCVTSPKENDRLYKITPSAMEFPVLESGKWTTEAWAFVAIVWGGKLCTEFGVSSKIYSEISKNYKEGKGSRQVLPSKDLFGEDPLPGKVKVLAIFYQFKTGGVIRCAAGLEGKTPCTLTDRLLQDASADDIAELEKRKKAQAAELSAARGAQLAAEAKLKDLEQRPNTMRDQWSIATLERRVTTQGYEDNDLREGIKGCRVQFVNSKTGYAIDVGGNGPHPTWLYTRAIYNHTNQVFVLNHPPQAGGDDEPWIIRLGTSSFSSPKVLATHDGRASIEATKGKLDPSQLWRIQVSPDRPFCVRIRSRDSKMYLQMKEDAKTELHCLELPKDTSLCDFILLTIPGEPEQEPQPQVISRSGWSEALGTPSEVLNRPALTKMTDDF